MLTNENNNCPKFQKSAPSDLKKNSFRSRFKVTPYFYRFGVLQKSPEASLLSVCAVLL